MIAKKSKPLHIFFPLALMVLGCFVAFSTTATFTKHRKAAPEWATTLWFKDTIKILNANTFSIKKESDSTSLTILEGNVILQQGKTIFKADKAIKNERQNTFEAWGHVHINDADTTDIYSDHLKYFGTPQVANLDGNVRLTDGQATLTTPSLDYNMITSTGVYKQGGKVVNKKTVITSKEGEYYADIKDVFFKKNVIVNDPAYKITADSLQYNTVSQIATFISMTHIKDSSNRSIDTREGYYNLRTGQAEFGQRPFINDNNASTLNADRVFLDDNIARAEGNAIAVDSTRGTIIIANTIFQNRLNEAILATQKPVMIIKQDNDSIYISADTLFSAKLSDLFETVITPPSVADKLLEGDSITPVNDNVLPTEPTPSSDSITTSEILVPTNNNPVTDSIPTANIDTIPVDTSQVTDSIAATITNNAPITDSSRSIDSTISITNDTVLMNRSSNITDSAATAAAVQNISHGDSTVIVNKKDARIISQTFDSTKKASTDSTDRYFEAFHNVRIYSDSMQAVSDSLFYSFRDSTFRLYRNPIVWGKESQITGDTILMHTKNKQPQWMEAFKNGFMVSSMGHDAYNQIKASRIDAYFLDGGLDSVRAKGSAECIYYLQDDDSAFTGVNQNSCDIIDSYFKNKQLDKVAFRGNVKGTIYPIQQKKPSEMKLEGFQWHEARRPKTKYELFE